MTATAIHTIRTDAALPEATLKALCRLEDAADGLSAIAAVLDRDAALGGTDHTLSACTRGGLTRAARILAGELQRELDRVASATGYQRLQEYTA